MLTIDARWVNRTGIGTYLTQVIPGIRTAFPDLEICLMGNRDALGQLGWTEWPNTRFVALTAAMYSLAEQWQVRQAVPQGTELLFCPHYNIPAFYRGRMLVTIHDLCHL